MLMVFRQCLSTAIALAFLFARNAFADKRGEFTSENVANLQLDEGQVLALLTLTN